MAVKRALILLALPALLLAVWVTGERNGDAAASVDVVSDKVTATRGAVINTIEGLGGQRVAEKSEFGDDGRSVLTFRLPTRQLERALADLDQLGGRVSAQEVDLSDQLGAARGLEDRLGAVGECLGQIPRSAEDLARVRDQVDDCSRSLRDVGQAASTTGADVVARLVVDIHPARSVNPLLVWAALAILAASVIMAVTVILSGRRRGEVDLREDTGQLVIDDDLYLRRN